MRVDGEGANRTAHLDFAKTDARDVGDYRVLVFATQQNYFKNTTAAAFLVTIYEQNKIDYFLKPVFSVALADQQLSVGQSLVYKPVFNVAENGWDI